MGTHAEGVMEETDRSHLRTAVHLLERPSLAIRLMSLLGYPIDGILRTLPRWISRGITNVTARAVGMAFHYALSSLERKRMGRAFPLRHRVMVLISGAAGGFFGLPGLIVDLPISTVLMLRSIADIARSEGEDLSSEEAQFACIMVFALGGRAKTDDAAESVYYAARLAVTRAVSEAAEFIAERGIAEEGAPILIRLMANLASRFGVIVTEKTAAELVPVLGAVGGATINLIFISHFQAVARGHFIMRRLERRYGKEAIKKEYEVMVDELRRRGAV